MNEREDRVTFHPSSYTRLADLEWEYDQAAYAFERATDEGTLMAATDAWTGMGEVTFDIIEMLRRGLR